MTGVDVAAARADTPGCAHVVHLNNAGASLPPRVVTDTVIAHLRREANIGGYEAAQDAADDVEAVYDDVASFLNASVDEIALVDSATRAWSGAFSGLRFAPGDRILTHRVEYASNFLPMLRAAARDGAEIEIVPDAPGGEVDVDALAARLDDRVRLVALTHVPSQSGLVNPAAAVGAAVRPHGIPFFLDACQSAGQLPLDVAHLGADVVALTGRKFLRAPRGTGVMYVRRSMLDVLEPPYVDLRGAEWTGPKTYRVRDDARRFELFERSIAGVLGLGAAVRYAAAIGIDDIAARVRELAEELRSLLRDIDGVVVRDEGTDRCGIVTFTLDGTDPHDVVRELRAAGCNTWVVEATSALLDLGGRALPAVVRASVHYYNTREELDRAVGEIGRLRAR